MLLICIYTIESIMFDIKIKTNSIILMTSFIMRIAFKLL